MVVIKDIDGKVLHTEKDADKYSGLWLKGVNLDKADFRGQDLSCAGFEACSMRGAVFADAVLHDVAFLDCDLSGCDFSEMFLDGASFSMSNLTGCNFSNADCSHVDFSWANFEDVNLDDATLDGSSIRHRVRHGFGGSRHVTILP